METHFVKLTFVKRRSFLYEVVLICCDPSSLAVNFLSIASPLTSVREDLYSPFPWKQCDNLPPPPPHIKKNLQPFPSAINNERSVAFYLHIFLLVGLCIFASTQIHQGHAPRGTIFCSATFEGLAAGPCQHYHTGVQVEQGGVSPPITTNKYVGM